MKKVIIGIIICFVIIGIFITKFLPQGKIISSLVKKNTTSLTSTVSQKSTTLFVPYWTLNTKTIPTNYGVVAYFGVSVNTKGLDTNEDGYKKINQFVNDVSAQQKTLLTIRLLDQDTDEELLHDGAFQQKIISESIALAKQYHFDGIVLDLEYKALAFDDVVNSTINLTNNFAKSAHSQHLFYYQLLYGDTFYRLRPFNAEAIGKVSDGIFVMAYDFHKANGNPGPNFPLYELSDEQYSFTQMVVDFEKNVALNKITIVFGMFGYDWPVDDKGQSIGSAESLTTNQILQKFIAHCEFKMCNINDNKALETEITYEDENNERHIVWFEDLTSVENKEDFLRSKGINSTAFWAYSYF